MTASTTAYEVRLPVFEGPLDLLLELIERAELDITRIALALVADQYLAYMRLMPDRPLADLASFLVIAARLLQIKSEALLPRPPVREPGEEDPGDALARQLVLYKKFKETAALLDDRQRAGLRSYLRLAPPPVIARTLDLDGLAVDDLLRAFEASLTTPEQPGADGGLVAPSTVSIRDQIGLIVASLRQKGQTTFQSLLRHLRSRLEVVVTFLAVLELVKQDRIRAQQQQLFGEIELVATGPLEMDQEADLEFGK
jgi:segregation and condensation protein A